MGRGGGETELHAAARSGDLAAVQLILSSNPLEVNSRDKHSRTPLHLAAWSGHAAVVSYLCEHRADVGAAAMDDMGAIHFAAQKGHLEIARTLLTSGVSVKSCTRKGLTPLHFAVQGSHLELVKYLVKKGASLTVRTKAGKTPLDLAQQEEIRSYLEECEQLSKQGKLNGKVDAEKPDQESSSQVKPEASGIEAPAREPEEELDDETIKRKSEDDQKEPSPEPKRVKVALNHLLSSDDVEEDENF